MDAGMQRDLPRAVNLLPLSTTSLMLVAGPPVDDISRQSGGWTLTWQGTGNTNQAG